MNVELAPSKKIASEGLSIIKSIFEYGIEKLLESDSRPDAETVSDIDDGYNSDGSLLSVSDSGSDSGSESGSESEIGRAHV